MLSHWNKIILVEISQGCATAIHALFNSCHIFEGFVSLSGRLPYVNQIEDICRAQSEAIKRIQYIKAIPSCNEEVSTVSGNKVCLEILVSFGHCKNDQVVPSFERGGDVQGIARLRSAS